jgi:hypothetical protein
LTRNRISTDLFEQDADRTAVLNRAWRGSGGGLPTADPLLAIRWEKVRSVRAALTTGHYDLDARLDDLLDDLPEELALLAAG